MALKDWRKTGNETSYSYSSWRRKDGSLIITILKTGIRKIPRVQIREVGPRGTWKIIGAKSFRTKSQAVKSAKAHMEKY